MSSIRARDDGRLFFDFRINGVRCRELTSLEDTLPNRRKMEKVLSKIEAEISLGTFDYARYFPGSKLAKRFDKPQEPKPAPSLVTRAPPASVVAFPLFSDFTATWKTNKQVEWRVSYRIAVESILDLHLIPAFGQWPLTRIDRATVLAFRSQLAGRRIGADPTKGVEGKPIAPATVNRIVGILRMILDEAAAQYEFVNPCLTIKRLKLQRQDVQPFTLLEMQEILGRVRVDYRPYLTLRFLTGVRSGEAHGLKWKHIDFARRQVLIRETYQNGRTEYTKTDGSQREIHMSQPVYDALSAMRPEHYEGNPQAAADTYVFHTRNGNPIDNTNFNDRVWKPLLRNLGLNYRRPYQMRHTCATLWLAAGESPEWIARQLGHTTTEMLFRTYSRYVPNLTRRDGRAFDTLVSGVINEGVCAAANDAPFALGMKRGGQHG